MASEGFQRQLQSVFEQQIFEHEQSVAHFVDTVASLCENEICDGHSVAKALRGVSLGARHGSAFGMGFAGQPIGHTGSGPTRYSIPSLRDVLPRVSAGGNSTPKNSASKSNRTLRDVHGQDAEKVKSQFEIERCEFITPTGRVQQPPSDFFQMLGPGVQGKLSRFRNKSIDTAERHSERHSFLNTIVESSPFKAGSVLAITLNYFFIIVQTDRKMADLNSDEPFAFRVIDLLFTVYYTLEVGATMGALRGQFFFGYEKTWNLFDLTIVAFSVFQEIFEMMDIKSVDTSFLRVLRFLRITKILRMFEAMRMFKEVKIMVDSLMGCLMIFSWCVLLLGLYLSVFGIFFVQGITAYREEKQKNNEIIPDNLAKNMQRDFGSILDSMVSLFMCITGGNDWIEFYTTVKPLGTLYIVLFIFYILFAIMSFLNVVTGVFCEKAMTLARPGAHEQMVRRIHKEVRDAIDLISLLKKFVPDEDSRQRITQDTFDEFLAHPEVVTYFQVRGMNPLGTHRFFEVLLDIKEVDHIDLATFVSAFVKLDGPASSIDLHVLSVELKAVQLGMHNLNEELLRRVHELSSQIKGMPAQGHAGQSRHRPFPVGQGGEKGNFRDSDEPFELLPPIVEPDYGEPVRAGVHVFPHQHAARPPPDSPCQEPYHQHVQASMNASVEEALGHGPVFTYHHV